MKAFICPAQMPTASPNPAGTQKSTFPSIGTVARPEGPNELTAKPMEIPTRRPKRPYVKTMLRAFEYSEAANCWSTAASYLVRG